MTIEKIKNNIDSKLGDNVKIIYNGSRNKKEEYSGIISETYNYIFIIKTDSDEVKSFSYRDVLTNTIELFLSTRAKIKEIIVKNIVVLTKPNPYIILS